MSEEDPQSSSSSPVLAALTFSEFDAVEAIAGRIIPTTETAGAIEAGSAYYIDQALAGPYRQYLGAYQCGITELDRHCMATFNAPFAALAPAQQDDVLESLEAGKIKSVSDGPRFFGLVLDHVMEGFFCEPHYGGNRDLIGWKLVGFPGQRYGYDDAYINRVIDLEPIVSEGLPRKVS